MVEIENRPLQKIVLHDINKYDDLDTFLHNALSPETSTIAWCDGYLLVFNYFRDAEVVTEDLMKGISHIAAASYCKFEKYQKSIKNAQNFEIQLINQSKNKSVKAVVDFIQKLKE